MPSLKTFRNRIASVKATRKITRAMQMVAAAKLKRAQDAAQAARPYAEKMAAVITSLAGSMTGNPGAPRLLTGTGADQVHLVIVATADRGLCGGFNTNIVRRARLFIEGLLRDGKEVKILCVGRKGRDQLRRLYAARIIDTIEMGHVKKMAFADAAEIGRRVLELYAEGAFDVATICYAKFKSVMTQEPTAQRLIPAPVEIVPRRRQTCSERRIRLRARRSRNPRRAAAAQCLRADLPRAARKRRVRTGRAHDRDGFGDPQRGRSDRQADLAIQPPASGDDHERTDRDHLRRRSALID